MVRINLLPIRDILRKRDLKRFIVLSCIALSATVGIMVFWYLTLNAKLSALGQDHSALQKRLEQLTERNKEITSLTKEEGQLKKQLNEIRKLVQNRDSFARIMEAISLTIPEDVWLESLEKTPNRNFTLVGKSLDNSSVTSFVEKLQTIRIDFTQKSLHQDPGETSQQTFFADVDFKGFEAATGGAETAKGTINFKIVGRLR